MDQMRDHERFEMLVLDVLNSARLLDPLIFGGGTMLRLCHGLDRYSVDLDFYLQANFSQSQSDYLNQLGAELGKRFRIMDQAAKRNTLLVEVSSPDYPRRLKLEVNIQRMIQQVEQLIAWSPASTLQVLINTVALSEMVWMKRDALLDRKEIRDAYDLEFLVRRGVDIPGTADQKQAILKVLTGFRPVDYKVKLGSILDSGKRDYYVQQGFRILQNYLIDHL